MSYRTDFEGQFKVEPVLTITECRTLQKWAEERHDGDGYPSIWCGWIPTEDGAAIEYTDEEMSAYEYEAWLVYIIEHYLKPWGVNLSGEVIYQGEEASDRGTLYARNNEVRDVPDVINRGPVPWAGE